MTEAKTITWDEWATKISKQLDTLETAKNWADRRIDTLFERFQKLEDELIEDLFLLNAQAKITKYLRHHPHSTQNEVMKQFPDWIKHSLCYHAFYEAWTRFEKAHVIISESHGRGHHRTWMLFTDKEG